MKIDFQKKKWENFISYLLGQMFKRQNKNRHHAELNKRQPLSETKHRIFNSYAFLVSHRVT